uniref:Uncharacterized protein n=1 Tax=Sphaerodactylus townsendi TaxID=933632 RepID=A0ACB8FCF3_9SAUR
MELEEHVRILKMTKQQLQEEFQKQNISCENKSVDEMKALLLSKLMAAGAASALTTQTSPSPKDAVRIQELELEKLRLQAEKEIELQRLRIQEEQRKEVQRQEDREALRREYEWEEKMLERKEKMQQEQRKHDLEMLRLQKESSRKINVTPKDFASPYREGGTPPIYLAEILKRQLCSGELQRPRNSTLSVRSTRHISRLQAASPGQLQVKDSSNNKPPAKAPSQPKAVKEERVAVVNHECLFTTMEPLQKPGVTMCGSQMRLRDQLVLGYADTGSSQAP